jgi:predicted MarR family transcription regulator
MKNIAKNADGTFTFILHLKENERKQVKKIAKMMNLNDFEAIKYAIQLVSWWSKNEIEVEE